MEEALAHEEEVAIAATETMLRRGQVRRHINSAECALHQAGQALSADAQAAFASTATAHATLALVLQEELRRAEATAEVGVATEERFSWCSHCGHRAWQHYPTCGCGCTELPDRPTADIRDAPRVDFIGNQRVR